MPPGRRWLLATAELTKQIHTLTNFLGKKCLIVALVNLRNERTGGQTDRQTYVRTCVFICLLELGKKRNNFTTADCMYQVSVVQLEPLTFQPTHP